MTHGPHDPWKPTPKQAVLIGVGAIVFLSLVGIENLGWSGMLGAWRSVAIVSVVLVLPIVLIWRLQERIETPAFEYPRVVPDLSLLVASMPSTHGLGRTLRKMTRGLDVLIYVFRPDVFPQDPNSVVRLARLSILWLATVITIGFLVSSGGIVL